MHCFAGFCLPKTPHCMGDFMSVTQCTCPLSAQRLTAIQMARCVVHSYPFYPNILAMVLIVAAAECDPGQRAQQRTAAHCQGAA